MSTSHNSDPAFVPSAWPPAVPRPRELMHKLLPRRGTPDGDERERLGRLSRMHGGGELRAAVLALLAAPNSDRELRAWRKETAGIASAEAVRRDVLALRREARLPWFELFADRAARESRAHRQALAEAARRVMRADGIVRPRDRLWWLALRLRLGDRPPPTLAGESGNELVSLAPERLLAIATFTAFLSRMVPVAEVDVDVAVDAGVAAGERWYHAVMGRFEERIAVPACHLPDVDATMRALRQLQTLPWMLLPVLARVWLDEAFAVVGGDRLHIDAADALRLAFGLLNSPLPPELARHHVEAPRR